MLTTQLMKALADDTRLRTFRSLAEASVGLCVAEVSDILQKQQYAVSRSLIELRKSGLVDEERRGKFVFYTVANSISVRELARWTLTHCECSDLAVVRNGDGSSQPGAPICHYDSERLQWRLSLRQPTKLPVTHPTDPAEPDPRPRVLFVCIHNSARSQLAEEYLRLAAGGQFLVASAGLTAGTLNPHVVAVLAEAGVDISSKETRSVKDLFRLGETFDWVITVCDREAEKNCPVFPGPVRRLSWPFADPSTFEGSEDHIRDQVRALAAEIKTTVAAFVAAQSEKEKS